jgi:bacterioferritin
MAAKTTPEYFTLLNHAVAREIQVSIQYMLQHAKMEKLVKKKIAENVLLDKTTYDAMGKFLREFAIVEMKHAAAIMERIYYLGGAATTKSDTVTIGGSLSEFAKLGVKAEEEALTLYRQIISEATQLGDWETKQMFEKIYTEEETHLFKFQEYANMNDEPEEPDAVPLSEWRKIFTQDYFDLLNKAVAAEISAIIQYTNQHEKAAFLPIRQRTTALEVVQDSNKAKVVSDLLKGVFMAEMDHLEKISERIYLLEGECVFTPDPIPQVGETPDDFLKLDHEAENYTLLLYRQIIAEALKRGDSKTRNLFEDIVKQEEDHYWTFDDYLK